MPVLCWPVLWLPLKATCPLRDGTLGEQGQQGSWAEVRDEGGQLGGGYRAIGRLEKASLDGDDCGTNDEATSGGCADPESVGLHGAVQRLLELHTESFMSPTGV